MKDFQIKMQQLIRENRMHSRAAALLTALTLLMMCIVPCISMKQGAAITTTNDVTDWNDGIEYFLGNAPKAIPQNSGYTNLSGKITNASFKVGNAKPYVFEKGKNNNEVTIDAQNANPVSLDVNMGYSISEEDVSAIIGTKDPVTGEYSGGQPYAYFQMDPKIQPSQSYFGPGCIITDDSWNPKKIAGYFSISETGLIIFRYSDEYIAHLRRENDNGNGGLNGSLLFTANVNRKQDEGGDDEFYFDTAKVKVTFDDTLPTIQKSGSSVKLGDDYGVDWSITITNPNGYVDLSKYTLTDSLNQAAIDWSAVSDFTVTPAGAASFGANGIIQLADIPQDSRPQQITITYRQTGVQLGDTNTNRVELTKGETVIPDEQTVQVENGLNISKSGKPDYELGGGLHDRIQWTIHVDHKSADSLRNVSVTDVNLPLDAAGSDLKVYDAAGALLDASKYTVNGNVLTFADDAAVPSSVNIVFWGPVDITPEDADHTQTNRAKASRTGLDEVDTGDSPVYYKHSMSLLKQLSTLNQETGAIEWQFTLIANDGGTATDDIYDYTIQDAAFANLTQEQINDMFGFNVYHREGSAEIKKGDQMTQNNLNVRLEKNGDTIKILFDRSAADQTINEIKIYYKTTIQDYLPESAWNDYQDGKSVPLMNTATAQDAQGTQSKTSGPVGQDIHLRKEAGKTYEGADNPQNYSFGSQDTTDRVLSWSADLIKDAGFAGGDKYTDVLKSYDVTENQDPPPESAVEHYFAADQRTLTLQGSATENGEKTAVSATDYTVRWFDAAGNDVTDDTSKHAVRFEITFADSVAAQNYRYITVRYASTADTSEVEAGHKVRFANSYDFGNHGEMNGMTYERGNPEDVRNLTLSVKKRWQDNNNVFETRPQTFTVRVLQALSEPDGSLSDSAEWKVVDTQTLNSDFGIDDHAYQLGTAYPQWKYDTETGEVRRYYYKIEEVLGENSGYVQTETITPVSFEPSANNQSKEFPLVNKSEKDFGKRAIDADGAEITRVTSAQVPVATHEGTDYYMFRWEILTDRTPNSVYFDTLPAGAQFVWGTESGFSGYEPQAFDSIYNCQTILQSNPYQANFEMVDGQLKVTLRQQFNRLRYYTAIPVSALESALDENDNLINTVTKDSKTETASLTVSDSPPQDDENYLTKAFEQGYAPGYLNYTIDVNPKGKKLSNTGMIDITDALSYLGGDVAASDLTMTLSDINVYPLVNGEAYEANPLSAGAYNYTVGYNQTDTLQAGVSQVSEKKWEITGWVKGDNLTVKLQGPPNYNGGWGRYEIRAYSDLTSYNGNYSQKTIGTAGQYFDADGQLILTGKVPEDAVKIAVFDLGDGTTAITDVSAEIQKNYPAKLEVSVPDETPLRITYSYAVSGWKTGDTLKFSNTASFHADNGDGKWSTGDHEMYTKSSAHVETNYRPKIYKVDVNNYAMNTITSTFRVAKLVNGEWVYADDVTVGQSAARRYRILHFPATPAAGDKEGGTPLTYAVNAAPVEFAAEGNGSLHEFQLEAGTLYKFVETSVDSEYRQPDWSKGFAGNRDFVFYYAYNGYSGEIPAEAEGKVTIIQKTGTINIPNAKTVSISAEKYFSGDANDLAHAEGSTVKLRLYWSRQRSGANMQLVSSQTLDVPAGFNPEKEIIYSAGEPNRVTWEGLPTGQDRAPVYYFVREVSYTYDGKTYQYDAESGKYLSGSETGPFQPVYTRNGTNTDGTVIEVNNSEGITVKKLWVDSEGNPVQPPTDTNGTEQMRVPFTVRGEKDGVKYPLALPVEALTAPDYTYRLPQTVTDSTGSHPLSYYDNFEITENLTDEQITLLGDDWTSSVTRKISMGTGTLEIINTKKTEQMTVDASVEKIWNGTPKDSVPVRLIQTTEALTPVQLLAADPADFTAISSGRDAAVAAPSGETVYTFDSAVTSFTVEPAGLLTAEIDPADAKRLIITGGAAEGSGTITAVLADGTKTIHAAVIQQGAVLTTGSLTKAWSGLPKYAADGTTEYHYYVLEAQKPAGYSVSYTVSGQKTTITNTKDTTSLFVQKQWITNDTDYIGLSPVFTLYRSSDSGAAWEPVEANTPTVSKHEKIWTYTYTGLDKYDESGTEYRYKVEEDAVAGYETFYGNPEGVTGGNSSTPVTVYNIRQFGLTVKKEWSDGSEAHANDEITIVLHRSVNGAAAPVVTTFTGSTAATTTTTTTTEQTTTTTTTTSTTTETTTTVTTTTEAVVTTTTSTISNGTLIEANNYKYFPVDPSKTLIGIRYTVVNDSDSGIAQPVWSVFNSEKVKMNDDWHDAWIDSKGETVVDKDNNLNYQGAAYVGFTAWTQNNNNLLSSFVIKDFEPIYAENIEPVDTYNLSEIEGQTLPLITNELYTVNTDSPITGIELSGNGNGKVNDSAYWFDVYYTEGSTSLQIRVNHSGMNWGEVVKVRMGDVTKQFYITGAPNAQPAPRQIPLPTQAASAASSLAGRRRITRIGMINQAEEIMEQNAGVSTIGQAAAMLAQPKIVLKAAAASEWYQEGGGTEGMSIRIRASDNWEKLLDQLPAYNAAGEPYYYWAEEQAVPGYTVSYWFNDGDADTAYCISAENKGAGEITVLNTKTDSAVLPETGSRGTKMYIITGAVLMLLTAAGYTTVKRRRWSSE